jgi:GrpB-like predicted nucleotidyltransferase (UPF0157 family)
VRAALEQIGIHLSQATCGRLLALNRPLYEVAQPKGAAPRQRNEQYEFHLLFRDYLQAHSEARQAYAALKKELAARFGSDRTSYTAAKQDFIRLLIQRASEEKAQVSREAHPPDQ